MNTSNNKGRVIAIAVIMAAVLSAFFLVANITALFITAYGIAMFGVALFCLGNLYLLSSGKSYPWAAALPIQIWRYLILQVVLSTVFVLLDELSIFTLDIKWFALLHIVIFAFFAVLLVILKGGKEIIEKRGEVVKEKVATLRFMQTDVESLMRKFPEHEKDLKQVADALRYSDPMSHASLAIYEEQIQRGILAMNDGANIAEQCAELLRQIADRNGKVKVLK